MGVVAATEINVGKGVIVAVGVKVNVDVGDATGAVVFKGVADCVSGKFSSAVLARRLHERIRMRQSQQKTMEGKIS